MAVAILYLPDAASGAFATRPVAGRSLLFRAVVAAARAGASVVGVPEGLRSARLAREVRRTPDAARAIRWLDGAVSARGFDASPCLLLPASTLAEAPGLRALLERGAGPAGAILSGTAGRGAPVLAAPLAVVQDAWPRLIAGQPLGEELTRHAERARPASVTASRPPVSVRSEADLAAAERQLYAALGTEADTGVDRHLHRRCSLPLTRVLVRTPATPNQVSLASLAVGASAMWCMWEASAASAAVAVLLYAVAGILDHSDGELARLTAQESPVGAHLDWTVDTVIHAGLVLAMGVTAAPASLGPALGALGVVGVGLSAALARRLPREIEVGPSMGGVLRHMGNRDLFYLVLLVFVLLRGVAPALLPGLAALVAVGSQCYWLACSSWIRRARTAGRPIAGVAPR